MAFTETKFECGQFGPGYLTAYKLKGDGSDTTLVHGYPNDEVLGIWMADVNDGAAQTISNAAGTATLGTTVTSGEYVTVFVWHK